VLNAMTAGLMARSGWPSAGAGPKTVTTGENGQQKASPVRGRPFIAPEMLLRAFYSIRSERQLMERLDFDLLFRWFVGLSVDDPAWDHSTFSKNRDRLLDGDIAAKFLAVVLAQRRVKRLLSSEHFSVDGTLIEAWASMKSFTPKGTSEDDGEGGGGRNASADFRGEKCSNDTHESATDSDAMLYRKGPGMEAKLCFIGHGLMENRSGLIVDTILTCVSGHAERLAALDMIEPLADRLRDITLGVDRGYDAADFVEELRTLNVRPRVAQNTNRRRSAIDRRTTRPVLPSRGKRAQAGGGGGSSTSLIRR